ncbi:MAG: OstA-like protein, partial [Flavobacteriales bacterium]|nr:OstA-like protein [Flavobacteriales bacterium]
MSRLFIFISINFLFINLTFAQEKKIIEIQKAGSSNQNEKLYPGGNILLKDNNTRVHLFHEGALIVSDKAFFYNKRNFFKAEGEVIFTQGDTLKMTCSELEYNGDSAKAKAWGNVVFDKPNMSLKTDTLYLDRKKNIGFYKNFAKIIDSSNVLTSQKGIFFMNENKYRFTSNVNIENPNYILKSERLDYYSDIDKALFYGPSNIYGSDYKIYSERGTYDLKLEKGFFKKNGRINYDGKIIYGDSLFFEKNKNYASATNHIKLIDTINNSVVYGHYGEIHKSKDSAIITKRAMSMYVIENDSLFIHADTLVITGEEKKRILRGYYDVRIFKSNIRGKSDSIYFEENTGNIELIKKPLDRKELQIFTEEDKNLRNPILWFGESQMTGNKIFLLSKLESKKLDSLKIIGDAFIIEKDSIDNNGFNQIKGGILNGNFV